MILMSVIDIDIDDENQYDHGYDKYDDECH